MFLKRELPPITSVVKMRSSSGKNEKDAGGGFGKWELLL